MLRRSLKALSNSARPTTMRAWLISTALIAVALSLGPAAGAPMMDRGLAVGGMTLQLVAADDEKEPELKPEQKMAKRYPQPVRVSFLLGLPVLDEKSSIIGYVHQVVRTPEGKIQLVMPLGGFLGLGTRLVPIPIEIVGMLGAQVAVIDMPGDRFQSSPTWTTLRAKPLDPSETIRVAITRR
jgi:PRC-barrel domain